MLGVEHKPPAFDILHGISSRLQSASDGLARPAWLNSDFSKFQYNGSAIKKQEGDRLTFQIDATRQVLPAIIDQLYPRLPSRQSIANEFTL
jgi:hypothetical protein